MYYTGNIKSVEHCDVSYNKCRDIQNWCGGVVTRGSTHNICVCTYMYETAANVMSNRSVYVYRNYSTETRTLTDIFPCCIQYDPRTNFEAL